MRQVEKHNNQIGLKKEDAIDRAKWRDDACELSNNINLATCVTGAFKEEDKPDLKKIKLDLKK